MRSISAASLSSRSGESRSATALYSDEFGNFAGFIKAATHKPERFLSLTFARPVSWPFPAQVRQWLTPLRYDMLQASFTTGLGAWIQVFMTPWPSHSRSGLPCTPEPFPGSAPAKRRNAGKCGRR